MEAVVHLDTHVVVWLYAGALERLPKPAVALIESSTLAVSPAVALELQYLFEIKRITEPGREVLDDLRGRIDLQVDDLSFSTVVAAALTMSWTRDPFDRLITAHAQARDVLLLTADKSIQKHYSGAMWSRAKKGTNP